MGKLKNLVGLSAPENAGWIRRLLTMDQLRNEYLLTNIDLAPYAIVKDRQPDMGFGPERRILNIALNDDPSFGWSYHCGIVGILIDNIGLDRPSANYYAAILLSRMFKDFPTTEFYSYWDASEYQGALREAKTIHEYKEALVNLKVTAMAGGSLDDTLAAANRVDAATTELKEVFGKKEPDVVEDIRRQHGVAYKPNQKAVVASLYIPFEWMPEGSDEPTVTNRIGMALALFEALENPQRRIPLVDDKPYKGTRTQLFVTEEERFNQNSRLYKALRYLGIKDLTALQPAPEPVGFAASSDDGSRGPIPKISPDTQVCGGFGQGHNPFLGPPRQTITWKDSGNPMDIITYLNQHGVEFSVGNGRCVFKMEISAEQTQEEAALTVERILHEYSKQRRQVEFGFIAEPVQRLDDSEKLFSKTTGRNKLQFVNVKDKPAITSFLADVSLRALKGRITGYEVWKEKIEVRLTTRVNPEELWLHMPKSLAWQEDKTLKLPCIGLYFSHETGSGLYESYGVRGMSWAELDATEYGREYDILVTFDLRVPDANK
jgi:hypothetical protein